MSTVQIIGPREIKALIAEELANYPRDTAQDRATVAAFERQLREPKLVTVNFSGGITQKCYSVTRGDGAYRVIYLPLAGDFSLVVESDFGPLDIGIHGPAIGCFASV